MVMTEYSSSDGSFLPLFLLFNILHSSSPPFLCWILPSFLPLFRPPCLETLLGVQPSRTRRKNKPRNVRRGWQREGESERRNKGRKVKGRRRGKGRREALSITYSVLHQVGQFSPVWLFLSLFFSAKARGVKNELKKRWTMKRKTLSAAANVTQPQIFVISVHAIIH